MNSTPEKQKIRAFLSKYIRRPNLLDGDDYFKLGFVNSLFAMQLVLFVEKEFGIKVPDEELVLENFRSIDAIDTFVTRIRSRKQLAGTPA